MEKDCTVPCTVVHHASIKSSQLTEVTRMRILPKQTNSTKGTAHEYLYTQTQVYISFW